MTLISWYVTFLLTSLSSINNNNNTLRYVLMMRVMWMSRLFLRRIQHVRTLTLSLTHSLTHSLSHTLGTMGEMIRDDEKHDNKHVVVFLDDMTPLRRLWQRAGDMISRVHKNSNESSSTMEDLTEMRHYYSPLLQRAACMSNSRGGGTWCSSVDIRVFSSNISINSLSLSLLLSRE